MDAAQDRDESLMMRVAAGERNALEPLVRRHATRLLSFLRRMTGDLHASEELFQDVFLAVWTKRHQYEAPRPFRSWLYAIALNRCRAAFRRPAPPSVSLDGEAAPSPPAPDASPADTAIATETAALVAGAVTLLPPQQRAVVVLRVWEQLSYAEIGDVLCCSEATARSHMHHGLAALRRYLEPRMS
jgi:RNA polymerase sigma-70 factor (ECF subfamily)